jgi:hypothetical protein
MASYTATVPSARTQEQTWDYLADFRSTVEWDPSITKATLRSGTPGEVGARFEITLSQLGKEMTFVYECLEAVRPSRLVYQADTDSLTSTDTITVAPDAAVTYDAQLELKGIRKVADPLMELGLTRASDKARDGLAEQLA